MRCFSSTICWPTVLQSRGISSSRSRQGTGRDHTVTNDNMILESLVSNTVYEVPGCYRDVTKRPEDILLLYWLTWSLLKHFKSVNLVEGPCNLIYNGLGMNGGGWSVTLVKCNVVIFHQSLNSFSRSWSSGPDFLSFYVFRDGVKFSANNGSPSRYIIWLKCCLLLSINRELNRKTLYMNVGVMKD